MTVMTIMISSLVMITMMAVVTMMAIVTRPLIRGLLLLTRSLRGRRLRIAWLASWRVVISWFLNSSLVMVAMVAMVTMMTIMTRPLIGGLSRLLRSLGRRLRSLGRWLRS